MAARSGPPANRRLPPAPADRVCSAGERVEKRLETLLADPIVQLLMERDGVERDVLLRMARTVRRRAIEREGSGARSAD